MPAILNHKKSVNGAIDVPGDKSLTHRAIITAAIADGDTKISHFLKCADTVATIGCLQKLGISIEDLGNEEILVHGKGLYGLECPNTILNVNNSGTTSRILTSILAGQNFDSEVRGDDSLNKRSMEKILNPLAKMGADIQSNNNSLPLKIKGQQLYGIYHDTNKVSVQTKSALLYAGLYAKGKTTIHEPTSSRDHTERVLKHFGADIYTKDSTVTITDGNTLKAKDIVVPGDLSSAAFLMGGALVLPDSELLLKNVSVSEARLGFITAIQQMGGDIQFINAKNGIEPVADILVKSSKLHGITIEKEQIPYTIDELPILTVLACFAEGQTIIADASELKYKETNRIDALVENLSRMGADIKATENGMIINGGNKLHGSIVGSRLDHRIAMCMSIAGICAEGKTELIGSECVKVSYPNFYRDLNSILVN